MKSFELRRDSDHSLLSEMRTRGIAQHDFLDLIPARKPNMDSSVALVTKEVRYMKMPILYIDSKGSFVDSALLSDLKTISIAKMSTQRHTVLGKTRKNIPLDTLVRFLLMSDVICTYVHIGSKMKVVFPNAHRAEVRGTHTYFTNEENTEPFSFSIEQDHTQTIHCLDLSS
ncbi:MAG: hypothetical protein CL916_07105 [Deltaproteobacteria bacterium]|nr:hypothetical protein [Deltaproteobacteria bacterium]